MNKYEREFFAMYAQAVKSHLLHDTPEKVEVYYHKGEYKKIRKVFREVLGDDLLHHVVYVEKPMEPWEKRLRIVRWGSMALGVYMIMILLLLVTMLVTGQEWRFLDLALYVGNVFGFGCSIYVLHNALTQKSWYFLWVGLIVLVLNGYQLIDFLTR